MILPSRLVTFLEGATIAQAGTRDRDLVPHVHRVSGWRVEDDGASVLCLFAAVFARRLTECLEDNGQIALTVSEAPSHETYQLKGRAIRFGPADASDRSVYEGCRDRGTRRLSEVFGMDSELLGLSFPPPAVRVVFEVRQVFDQSPGPRAGRRLDPGEAD